MPQALLLRGSLSRPPALLAGQALLGDRLVRDVLLELDHGGSFARVAPRAGRSLPLGTLDLSSRIVVPGTCNAHSHAFQVLLRGRCDGAGSFREWVDRHLYPLVETLDLEGLRAAARLAFTEMLLSGVTSVGEFHYLNRGPGGADAGNEAALAVIAAAREVGLRTTLLRALYDRPGAPARVRFLEAPETSLARLDELARETAGDPLVSVAPAPHSLHGASAEALRAGDAWASRRGTPLHVHLAEQEDDVRLSLELHGATPLRAIERLGLLSERLVVVHGCWLADDEIRDLGAARGGLAYNPSSNMALGDGVTDIPAMLAAGVRVGLGTDGACANNQFDVFREMRTVEHLQRVTRRRMGVLTAGRGGAPLFHAGTVGGASLLGVRAGRIEPGWAADVLALDPDDPSLQPLGLSDDEAEEGALLQSQLAFAVAIRGALTDVLVGGEVVLADRRAVRVDPAEVARSVRRALRGA